MIFQSSEPDKRGHAKFTNYRFDSDEFIKLVKEAEEHILARPDFPGHEFRIHDEF